MTLFLSLLCRFDICSSIEPPKLPSFEHTSINTTRPSRSPPSEFISTGNQSLPWKTVHPSYPRCPLPSYQITSFVSQQCAGVPSAVHPQSSGLSQFKFVHGCSQMTRSSSAYHSNTFLHFLVSGVGNTAGQSGIWPSTNACGYRRRAFSLAIFFLRLPGCLDSA